MTASDRIPELPNDALETCASEPIHRPGSIQPRGVLVALDRNCQRVLVASANAGDHFCLPMQTILGGEAAHILGHERTLHMRAVLATAGEGVVVPIESIDDLNGPDVLVHRCDDRVIVEIVHEFEAQSAAVVLRSAVRAFARARGTTPTAGADVASIDMAGGFHRVAATLAIDPDLGVLCNNVAHEVRRITGYDRVMVYRFDPQGHGDVIAEAKREILEPFFGLHYPASDIPAQARALYLHTRVRALENVGATPVPLLADVSTDAQRPLDLRYALLRSMSPVHLAYLVNMGVTATLVVSIIVEGKLWGLVSCHHLSSKWPSSVMRMACDMLSEFVSVQVTVLENLTRARAMAAAGAVQRAVVQRLVVSRGRLEEVLSDLRTLVPASGLALVTPDAIWVLGDTPPATYIRSLARWLDEYDTDHVFASQSVRTLDPPLAEHAGSTAGVLSVDLGGPEVGSVIWFRTSATTMVRWAGAPRLERHGSDAATRLTPRASFAEWVEQRDGTCEPWTADEVAVADVVRGAIVDVLREISASRQRSARLDYVRIRSAVEAASDAIAVTDADGRPIYLNPAFRALVGYDLETLSDPRVAFDLRPPPPAAPPRTASDAAAALPVRSPPSSSIQRHADVDAITRGGDRIPVALRIDPIVDDRHTLVGVLFMASDLRPRRAMEAERQRLEQVQLQRQKLESLGLLAGGIAHDFNNLLTTIVANAALACESLPQAAIARENLESINRAADHAASLCRELLAYAGRDHFVLEPVSIAALLRDVAHLLRAAAGANCTTRFHVADDLPLVEGDLAQLRQVFMNLLVNAADAIGDDIGRIDVTVARRHASQPFLDSLQSGTEIAPGAYVEITVADTGCGMSDETIQRVFDPFFSTKFTGRGLGLAAVNGIVRSHRGGLHLSSTLGVGTTFTVLLPVSDVPPLSVATMARRTRVDGRKRTILLVDDNDAVRSAAQRVLARADFQIVTAEDGRDALAIMYDPQQHIDLIVSDVTMPHMGGLALLATLRKAGSETPVVLMSGYSEESALSALASDARAAFVQKPFDVDQLLTTVETLLEAAVPAHDLPGSGER